MDVSTGKFLNRSSSKQWESRSDLQIVFFLLAFLISVFSITYSGHFISDDEHLLTSRTLSLAFDQNVSDARVYGNSRRYALTNTSQIYAAQAANIEPGQAVVGAIFVRVSELLGLGRVQTIYLVNIWATAITGVVLFVAVRRMGYAQRTAIWTTLIFGVGSIAWPYSRTYFRDTLAMLFLAIAWACVVIITQSIKTEKSSPRSWIIYLLMIISLTAGILTKNTIVIALPFLLGNILYVRIKQDRSIDATLLTRYKTAFFCAGAGVLVFVLWVSFTSPTGIFARYSLEYYQLLAQKFFFQPHPHFFEALLGPLVSPGKSIFIYSPILVISLLGLFAQSRTSWPAWMYLVTLVLGQALFYDDAWWGHINWGLRFTLPAIPPLILSAVPVLDTWLRTSRGRVGLWGIILTSFLLQIIGILIPLGEYYKLLYSSSPTINVEATVWDPQYSAVLWGAGRILRGEADSLAIMQDEGGILLGFCILIVVIGIAFMRMPTIKLAASAMGISLLMSVLIVFSYKDDPYYHLSRKDLSTSHQLISRIVRPEDLIIIKSYGAPVWYYWMNWADSQLHWTSLPYYFPSPETVEEYNSSLAAEDALDEITLSLLDGIPGNYTCVWLLIAGDSPGSNLNIEVKWLEQKSLSNTNWKFNHKSIETRLYLFDFTNDPCG